MKTMRLSDVHRDGCMTIVSENENGTLNYESLVPGQFEKARRLLPDELYGHVEALWSDDVVQAWRDSLRSLEGDQ